MCALRVWCVMWSILWRDAATRGAETHLPPGAECVKEAACLRASVHSPSHLSQLELITLPSFAEYVKERILALRKQHPGQYQNASVVRAPAP